MRFFKRFHHRARSEPVYIDSVVADFISQNSFARRPTLWPGPAQDITRRTVQSFAIPDARGSAIETEVIKLRLQNLELLEELNNLQAQVHQARAELYHERQTSVCQQEEDKKEIQELKLALEAELTALHLGSQPLDVDQALQIAVSASEGEESHLVSPTLGPRSSNDYKSALKLTLKTRTELKNMKKTKKFWKRVAQQEENNCDIVTPSCSNISSVHEQVSLDRQKAVERLLAKRRTEALRGTLSPVFEADTPQLPASIRCTSPSPNTPIISGDVFSHTPTAPAAQQLLEPSLSPLASHSLRMEVSRLSNGGKRLPSKLSWGPNVQAVNKAPTMKNLSLRPTSASAKKAPARITPTRPSTTPRGILKTASDNVSTPTRNLAQQRQHLSSDAIISGTSSDTKGPSESDGLIGEPEMGVMAKVTSSVRRQTVPTSRRPSPLDLHRAKSPLRPLILSSPETPTFKRNLDHERSKSRLPVSSLKKQLKRLSLTKTGSPREKENILQYSPISPKTPSGLPVRPLSVTGT